MSQAKHEETTPTTLDKVFKALQYWRSHKDQYEGAGIPDEIWRLIFQLENNKEYSSSELKKLFALNSKQYQIKHSLLCKTPYEMIPEVSKPEDTSTAVPKDPVKLDFAEATVDQTIPSLAESAHRTKQVISQLKSTHLKPAQYLDPTTIVVECIRPDGHRLKIHATTQSLDRVMQTFIQQGVSAS
jgi:hypothetical protein